MKLELIENILKLEEEIIAKGIKFESIFKISDNKEELQNLKEDMEIALASHQEEEVIEEGDLVRSKHGKTILTFFGYDSYGRAVVTGITQNGRTINKRVNLNNYVLVKKGNWKNG